MSHIAIAVMDRDQTVRVFRAPKAAASRQAQERLEKVLGHFLNIKYSFVEIEDMDDLDAVAKEFIHAKTKPDGDSLEFKDWEAVLKKLEELEHLKSVEDELNSIPRKERGWHPCGAGCRGWHHWYGPFEIEICDSAGRFDPYDIESHPLAIEAHRRECGCPWPEIDYQDAAMSWLRSPVYADGATERIIAEDQQVLVHLMDLLEERETFLANLPSSIHAVDAGRKHAHLDTTKRSLEGLLEVLHTVAREVQEGRLSQKDFSDSSEWGECGICGKGVTREESLWINESCVHLGDCGDKARKSDGRFEHREKVGSGAGRTHPTLE